MKTFGEQSKNTYGFIDQAQGLRNLLPPLSPKSCSVFAIASSIEQPCFNNFLLNLACATAEKVETCILLDFTVQKDLDFLKKNLPSIPTASDSKTTSPTSTGPEAAVYCSTLHYLTGFDVRSQEGFSEALKQLIERDDRHRLYFLPIDTLALPSLDWSLLNTVDFIIGYTSTMESIMKTYTLIKTIMARASDIKFRLLTLDIEGESSSVVQDNLMHTAHSFLGLKLDSLAFIFYDSKWQYSEITGKCLMKTFPDSPAALQLKELAKKLLPKMNITHL